MAAARGYEEVGGREMTADKQLTGPLGRIARVIGVEPTLRLAEGLRDREARIPKRPRANHPWLAFVTAEALAKLCASPLAGESVSFPSTVGHGDKKSVILDLAEQGQPVKDIALAAGCSRRYVSRVLRGFRVGSGVVGGGE